MHTSVLFARRSGDVFAPLWSLFLPRMADYNQYMLESPSHIVLVHGLGRSRHDMVLLKPRLQAVFPNAHIHTFDYQSRRIPVAEASRRLAEFVDRTTHGESVSFVGHSLGGIVVRALDASEHATPTMRRLVTLGSPHNGARIAHFLARYRLPQSVFGPALAELGELSLPPRPRTVEIGCVVGATGNRFGFLPIFGEDNDGVVLAREALLEGCAGHVRVPVLHAFMPFSKRVANLVAHFLARGTFTQPPTNNGESSRG